MTEIPFPALPSCLDVPLTDRLLEQLALGGRLTGRLAGSPDRGLMRQIVTADTEQMLAMAPSSARNLMVAVQVEGRMQHVRHGHPAAYTILLGEGAAVVGMVSLDGSGTGPVALRDLLIVPPLRGCGRGGAAMSALCAVADAVARPLSTTLFYDNPARHFLARFGFVVTGEDGLDLLFTRPS